MRNLLINNYVVDCAYCASPKIHGTDDMALKYRKATWSEPDTVLGALVCEECFDILRKYRAWFHRYLPQPPVDDPLGHEALVHERTYLLKDNVALWAPQTRSGLLWKRRVLRFDLEHEYQLIRQRARAYWYENTPPSLMCFAQAVRSVESERYLKYRYDPEHKMVVQNIKPQDKFRRKLIGMRPENRKKSGWIFPHYAGGTNGDKSQREWKAYELPVTIPAAIDQYSGRVTGFINRDQRDMYVYGVVEQDADGFILQMVPDAWLKHPFLPYNILPIWFLRKDRNRTASTALINSRMPTDK